MESLHGRREGISRVPRLCARHVSSGLRLRLDLWISIPKPSDVGVLGGAVQRALHGDFDGYAGSVAKAWLPLGEEALIGGVKPMDTAAELIANYDFPEGATLFRPSENDLRLELRSTENAKELARTTSRCRCRCTQDRSRNKSVRCRMGESASQRRRPHQCTGRTFSAKQLVWRGRRLQASRVRCRICMR